MNIPEAMKFRTTFFVHYPTVIFTAFFGRRLHVKNTFIGCKFDNHRGQSLFNKFLYLLLNNQSISSIMPCRISIRPKTSRQSVFCFLQYSIRKAIVSPIKLFFLPKDYG